MAFTKKATTQTEVVLGTAVSNMRKAAIELDSAVDTVKQLADQAENYQGQIAEREERIKSLDQEYAEKVRAAQVAFSLQMKEDQEKAVNTVLLTAGKVSVPKAEYDATMQTLQQLKSDMQKDIQKEVAIVTTRLTKEFEQAKALAQAEFNGQQAQTKAELSQKEQQITFLTEQVNMWKKALDDERAAGVERAKAGAVGTINLGSTGNGR